MFLQSCVNMKIFVKSQYLLPDVSSSVSIIFTRKLLTGKLLRKPFIIHTTPQKYLIVIIKSSQRLLIEMRKEGERAESINVWSDRPYLRASIIDSVALIVCRF